MPLIEYHSKNIIPKLKNISPIVFAATETIFIGTLAQKRFFKVVIFATVISSSKQTAVVMVPFFYRVQFPRHRNRPRRDPKFGQFSEFRPS
jgi:hypothetical protein